MQPVSAFIFRLYEGTPRHGEWVVACLEGCWQTIVGAGLAQACRPGGFSGGSLTIVIGDPAWEAALAGLEENLGEKLRSATGGVVRRVILRQESARQRE